MRIGTPGFVSNRLVEGREARGLSQTALAELTGIKSQSISHYEQGRQSPSPDALRLLCERLNLPERFFLRPVAKSNPGVFFFRHSAAGSRAARMRAERVLSWMQEIVLWSLQHVDLPDSRLPDRQIDPENADFGDEVERIAGETRAALGVGFGPITNLTDLLESGGCAISILPLEPELGGSCSRFHEDISSILLAAGETRPAWSRYFAACELGHLIMHRGQPGGAHFEAQAARFARAFLLPAATFPREVWAPNIDALVTLKKDWRCPVTAMIARCGDIGVFNTDQVRRAMVNLGRRGWKAAEPRENAIPAETPRLIAGSLKLVIEESLKTPHSVLMEIGLGGDDIERIAGLPSGFFATCERSVPGALRLRRADAGEGVRITQERAGV